VDLGAPVLLCVTPFLMPRLLPWREDWKKQTAAPLFSPLVPPSLRFPSIVMAYGLREPGTISLPL
jgi:hypothetical protein